MIIYITSVLHLSLPETFMKQNTTQFQESENITKLGTTSSPKLLTTEAIVASNIGNCSVTISI